MKIGPYVAAVATLVTLGCGARGTPVPAAPAAPPAAAGARFVQDMIAHHAQALAMTALAAERAARPDLRQLAARIEATQEDEIRLMRQWLAARGHDTAASHAHHAAPMPGMLSAEELARLGRATGTAFDRLFLESMIRHHEGALAMVAALFATDGATQDVELFQFASAVDSDQRAEIARMRTLLASFPQRGSE